MRATRHNSAIDQFIEAIDHGLRATFTRPVANRPSPAAQCTDDPVQFSPELKSESAALMRVNHVGEVCAQALYQGQALTSRSDRVRDKMQSAAEEEIDHLNWCYDRIEQLDGHPSLFNPLWYAGSFALGVGAGLIGDKWSLGFLAETEKQVVAHLNSHLEALPIEDTVSRTVVEQMAEDEANHADMAIAEGAAELPAAIKSLMKLSARFMTTVAHKI